MLVNINYVATIELAYELPNQMKAEGMKFDPFVRIIVYQHRKTDSELHLESCSSNQNSADY